MWIAECTSQPGSSDPHGGGSLLPCPTSTPIRKCDEQINKGTVDCSQLCVCVSGFLTWARAVAAVEGEGGVRKSPIKSTVGKDKQHWSNWSRTPKDSVGVGKWEGRRQNKAENFFFSGKKGAGGGKPVKGRVARKGESWNREADTCWKEVM